MKAIFYILIINLISNESDKISCIKNILEKNKLFFINDIYLSKNVLKIDSRIEQFLHFLNYKFNEKKININVKNIKLIELSDINTFFKIKEKERALINEINNELKIESFLNNEINHLVLNLLYEKLPDFLKIQLNDDNIGNNLRIKFKYKLINLFKDYFDYNRFLIKFKKNKIFINDFKETILQLIEANDFFTNHSNYDNNNIINILNENYFFNKYKYLTKNIFFRFLFKLNKLVLIFNKYVYKNSKLYNLKLNNNVNKISNKFINFVVDEIVNSSINFFSIDNNDIKNIFIENLNNGLNLKNVLKDEVDSLFDNFDLYFKNKVHNNGIEENIIHNKKQANKPDINKNNSKETSKTRILEEKQDSEKTKLTLTYFLKNNVYNKYWNVNDDSKINPIINYYCNQFYSPKLPILKKLFCNYFNKNINKDIKEFIDNEFILNRFKLYFKILDKKILSSYNGLIENYKEMNLTVLNIFYGENIFQSFKRMITSIKKLLNWNIKDIRQQLKSLIKKNILYFEILIRRKLLDKLGSYYLDNGVIFYTKNNYFDISLNEIKYNWLDKLRLFIYDNLILKIKKFYFIKKIKKSIENHNRIDHRSLSYLKFHKILNLFNLVYYDNKNEINNKFLKCGLDLNKGKKFCESIYGLNNCEKYNNFYSEKCPDLYTRKGIMCEFDCNSIGLENKKQYCVGDNIKDKCSKNYYFEKKNICFKPYFYFTNFIFWPYY